MGSWSLAERVVPIGRAMHHGQWCGDTENENECGMTTAATALRSCIEMRCPTKLSLPRFNFELRTSPIGDWI